MQSQELNGRANVHLIIIISSITLMLIGIISMVAPLRVMYADDDSSDESQSQPDRSSSQTDLYYMQNIEDDVIYELAQLVLRSDKVRIRTMHELEEADQDDPIMPNKWIYHKNSDLNEVLNYVRNVYDEFRIEDEIDEHHTL